MRKASLPAGSQVGPYEIVSLLGAGAMGEVYRARDTRLGRDVAIKVLPASVVTNEERLRRFEQEARATGLLNHPNILAIYDVGRHEGSPYVVTELLEGETLRARLAQGPLPPAKAVDHATQIARGLAAAHDKGIVHRDLKPENLFVTPDGQVKILDFGLAKLTRPEAASGSSGETVTETETAPGVVIGTAGYMSPEQVRGMAVDHRSDIFCLGAIFYEMLTGTRAFSAASPVETMHTVLGNDPPGLLEGGTRVPGELNRIAKRCLEKRPEERFQSARDLAFALEAVSSSATLTVVRPSRRRTWRVRWRSAVAGLGLVGLAVLGTRAWPIRRAAEPTFERLTYRRGYVTAAFFVPGGRDVVYAASWEGSPIAVFLRRPDSPHALPLDLPSATVLSVSRSGELAILLAPQRAHYGVYRGTLATVPVSGGSPRAIADDVQQADWAPDGRSLAIVRDAKGRAQLEYPVGTLRHEAVGHLSYPRIHPDGRRVAFFQHPLKGDDRGVIAILDTRGGGVHVLSNGWESVQGLAWSPSGDEVWFTATGKGQPRSLWAVTPSRRLRLVFRMPGPLLLRDVSNNGDVLLTRDDICWGVVARPPGAVTDRDLSWLDFTVGDDLSPDGQRLLFEEQSLAAGPHYSVCVRDTEGGAPTRLGEGTAFGFTEDGRWALSWPLVAGAPFVLLPTGPGQPRTFDIGGRTVEWAAEVPGGRTALLALSEGDTPLRLWNLDLGSGALRLLPNSGVDLDLDENVAIAPDGRRLAVVGPERRVWLVPLGAGKPVPLAGSEPDDSPVRWAPDGQAVFVTRDGDMPVPVIRQSLSGARTLLTELRPANPAGIGAVINVIVTPDGRGWAYTYCKTLSELHLATGLH